MDVPNDLATTIHEMVVDWSNKAKEMQPEAGQATRTKNGFEEAVGDQDVILQEQIKEDTERLFGATIFVGEEDTDNTDMYFGTINDNKLRIVIDPIDGSKNYLKGSGNWGITCAVMQGKEVILGFTYEAPNNRTLISNGDKLWINGTLHKYTAPSYDASAPPLFYSGFGSRLGDLLDPAMATLHTLDPVLKRVGFLIGSFGKVIDARMTPGAQDVAYVSFKEKMTNSLALSPIAKYFGLDMTHYPTETGDRDRIFCLTISTPETKAKFFGPNSQIISMIKQAIAHYDATK